MASRTKKELQRPILAALIAAAGVFLGIFLTHLVGTTKEKEVRAAAARLERLTFYQTIKVRLEATDSAFKNQAALRDRLVETLKHRYGSLDLKYEPLFQKYHSRMTDEELFLCEQMRGLTETLNTHNTAVRDLLTAHPSFYAELPELKALYEHLDLWTSKHNKPFKDNKEACLVYVGVAEEKPFPQG